MYVAEFVATVFPILSDHAKLFNMAVSFLYKLPMPGPLPSNANILTDTLIKNFDFALFGVIVMANLVAPTAKGFVLFNAAAILSEILYEGGLKLHDPETEYTRYMVIGIK